MPEDVFSATLEQLAVVDFHGRISYHLYNEPLLRVDLHRLVRRVAQALPEALQVLNTNGDLLDERRYTELRQAGVDYFYVTRHSEGEYPARDWQIVQYSEDLVLTNRGGKLSHLPVATPQARHTPCHAPSEMLIVTVTGDVLLCYEDADRDHVLGNVLRTPIWEIWRSAKVRELQRRLAEGDRTTSVMCLSCTNVSHREPGLSALETPVLSYGGLESRAGAVEILKQASTVGRNE